MDPIFNANTNTTQTAGDILKALREAEERMRLLKQKMLRSLGKVAEMECGVCKRKVVVRSGPFGTTLVVCPHMHEELKRQFPSQAASPVVSAVPPLDGIAVEVEPDEPRRW